MNCVGLGWGIKGGFGPRREVNTVRRSGTTFVDVGRSSGTVLRAAKKLRISM